MSQDPVAVASQLLAGLWPQIAPEGRVPAFPKQMVWLNGAPGAGKGTNTRTIMQVLGIQQPPIVISDLLTAPEFVAIKNSGGLVGDKDVIGLLLKKLLEPAYAAGVIIDGFPRSRPQAEFLRLLVEKLRAAGQEPMVRIVVLDVPEAIAVERQLKRGREAVAANELARKYGGPLQEIRPTDVDPAAAAKRYRVFQEQTVAALKSLEGVFPCHFIDASADIPTVRQAIARALGG